MRVTLCITLAWIFTVQFVEPAAAQSPLAPTEDWPTELFDSPEDGIAQDGQNDRGILTTTAQIQPARSVTLQYDYLVIRDLFGLDDETVKAGFLAVKVGVTPRVQLSFMTDLPRDVGVFAPGIKYQFFRRDRVQVAAHATYMVFRGQDAPSIANYGAVASRCLDLTCATLLSANLSHRFQTKSANSGALVAEVALLFPVMDHIKFVGEVQLLSLELSSLTKSPRSSVARYGLRYHRWHTALTVSVEKPLGSLGATPDIVWVIGTARY